jgi:hypothetical protein
MVESDAALMDACPDFVSVGSLLKAHPQEDGGRRFVYFEASNEGLDQQDEVILSKALADSKDFYLRYGNVDIDHYTQIGARAGIPDYPTYEIGQPVEVGQRGGSTFVKSQLYAATSDKISTPMLEKANMVWDGLTKVDPPQRWYPSVGGAVLQKAIHVDEATQARRAVISKVRWSNVGLSRTPVNQHVSACAAAPIGMFAKCLAAQGVIDFSKTLTAGYGTDSATLSGGASLRQQSLDGGVKSYWDFRERLAQAMREGTAGKNPKSADLVRFAAERFGLSHDEAAEYVERFVRDLQSGLTKRKAA